MPGRPLLDLSPEHFLKECRGHLLAGEYASFNSTSSAVKVAEFQYNPMLHLHINLSPSLSLSLSLSLFLVLTVHICNVFGIVLFMALETIYCDKIPQYIPFQ